MEQNSWNPIARHNQQARAENAAWKAAMDKRASEHIAAIEEVTAPIRSLLDFVRESDIALHQKVASFEADLSQETQAALRGENPLSVFRDAMRGSWLSALSEFVAAAAQSAEKFASYESSVKESLERAYDAIDLTSDGARVEWRGQAVDLEQSTLEEVRATVALGAMTASFSKGHVLQKFAEFVANHLAIAPLYEETDATFEKLKGLAGYQSAE